MGKTGITFAVLLFILTTAGVCHGDYTYWVAYTGTIAGPSGFGNSFSGTSLADGNHVEVDLDNDAVIDFTYDLNDNEGFSVSPLPGTKIVSTYPLQATYSYTLSDHGAYEDGTLRYVVLPQRSVGDDYYMPIDSPYAAALSIHDGTVIEYDANNDGIPEQTFNLDEGEDQLINIVAGGHLWANYDFYLVGVNHTVDCYDSTSAFPVMPVDNLGQAYVSPAQHGYSHSSSTDYSGVHVVCAQNNVNVTINTSVQNMDAGDVWFYPTALETAITADGPIFAVYRSAVSGMDPWRSVIRSWEFAFPIVPPSYNVNKFYTSGRAPSVQGGPQVQLFIASYSDGNLIHLECTDGNGTHDITLNDGEIFYLHETDATLPCWQSSSVEVTSTAPMHGSMSFRGWWSNMSESTQGWAYLGDFCQCESNEDCDDGQYCNGVEFCTDCVCHHSGNPCPVDDTLFCNGEETADCDEDTDTCGHTGDPCFDDGAFCNGAESCDDESDSCISTGDPCADDEQFCNGEESCDEDQDECTHSGYPCEEFEACDEYNDECLVVDDDDDDNDDDNDDDDTDDEGGPEDLWPEGEITGGCCGS